jgi:hypothetical protein
MSALETSVLHFVKQWSVMKFVNNMGGDKAVAKGGKARAVSSSAIGLISVPQDAPDAFFAGGRVLELLWLEATRRNLAIHVLGVSGFFYRLYHGGEGFSEEELKRLSKYREQFCRHFKTPDGHTEAMLFRIMPPNTAVDRTLRRGVDAILKVS